MAAAGRMTTDNSWWQQDAALKAVAAAWHMLSHGQQVPSCMAEGVIDGMDEIVTE